MPDTLQIPKQWEDVTPAWMTAALAQSHPGAEVADVKLLLRDDGTNRRARFGLKYASGSGPATVFAKAESDAPGRREIHAANGNLFNEPRLFNSGIALPVDHPMPYLAVIDEAALDYIVVMEDVVARGADPRNATRPLTVDQAARGVRALARLHSCYWNKVTDHPALGWVQPYEPVVGWQAPMKAVLPLGLKRAGSVVPEEISARSADELVGGIWARYVGTLTGGCQTLLHGDPHIGNTYVLPSDEVGFLDWQVVRRGHWSFDVSYFLVSALTPVDRRAHEVELLEAYRQALDVPPGDRPTTTDVWLRYRASPAHGLIVWATTAVASDVHPIEVSRALVERYAAAFVDLDTPSALDALAG